MRNTISKITLTAFLAFAITFTLSCSSGDDPVGGGSSSSVQGGGGGKGNNMANYQTVVIGGKRWMAENLDYAVEGSVCYDNLESNCNTYGRLYNWSTAMGVCPSGWHLPSDADWDALVAAVGGSSTAGTKLKATSGWNDCGPSGSGSSYLCEDEFGFSALPGGLGDSDGGFYPAGSYGSWWSATEGGASGAYGRYMYGSSAYMYGDLYVKADSLSVRCAQD